MRKTLTPEQKAAREERRARFKALWKEVAAMPDADRLAMCARLGIVTADGHPLSPRNMCLVAMQNPAATVVGGFRQWQKQGRCVKAGQHGAMIWVPIGTRKNTEAADDSPSPDETGEGRGEGKNGTGTAGARFIIGTVFDISQTQELAAERVDPAPLVTAEGPVDLEAVDLSSIAASTETVVKPIGPASLAVPRLPRWRKAA